MSQDGPDGQGLTIGAVLELLREEFPDLTISKVRFLDARGLVSPRRRESGYRVYDEQDVRRLRFVLTAQRDRYWPLKVIREALDAVDEGRPEHAPAGPLPLPAVGPTARAREADRPAPPARLTRAELAAAAGLGADTVTELEEFRLIGGDAQGHFTAADLAVARAARELAEFGLAGRHLRVFRLAADRQIDLVRQATGPGERRRRMADACLELHTALLRSGLRE